jgi:hypothetical protein
VVADDAGQLFALGYAGVTWLPLHAGLPLCPALSATSTPVFALW